MFDLRSAKTSLRWFPFHLAIATRLPRSLQETEVGPQLNRPTLYALRWPSVMTTSDVPFEYAIPRLSGKGMAVLVYSSENLSMPPALALYAR